MKNPVQLTASNVRDTVLACLYKPEELPEPGQPPAGAVIVRGVIRHMAFHPERLEAQKETIRELLGQLNDAFMNDKGGGMSFLNMPFDREERHWGEHQNCDDLICLGLGVGMVTFAMRREYWNIFPGDMPYVIVDTRKP